jgi:tetratricopeptide (TPR) repeat protein
MLGSRQLPHEEPVSRAINDAVIRRLASGESYQKGQDYLSGGHVDALGENGGSVSAVVRGTHDYAVTLGADEGVLDYSCDCPLGSEGAFCKHCVAVALAWLNRTVGPVKPAARGKAKEMTLTGAKKILETEDKDTLIRMMFDWAKDDDRLHGRIIVYAARRSGPDSGAAAVRRKFEKAVRVRDFVSYREAAGWARGVDDAIDSVEQLLQDGQFAVVIELCESALRSLLGSIQSVDDSDGHFGDLRDRLQDIHYRACREGRPDPVELAARLFHWEMHGDFDVFFGAAARYAKILGAKGMKAYRELADAEWEKVPVRTAKQGRSEWGRHFRITHIMESLAQASGDVEQLVAVMSRDLSSAYSYLRIAETYREAGQHDNALLWVEKGLKAFPERTDSRLREFAAEEYHRRRRHDDAMKLMWAEFLERPFLEAYKTLQRHAKKAGAWPEWRERALAELRLRIAKAREIDRGPNQPLWMRGGNDNSPLVEIFLFEGDTESAWREAQTGGCSDSLWLRLAAVRENEHPEDAAPIYLKQAEAAVASTSNGRYEDAVGLLVKAATVMRRMDRGAEFIRQLDALRLKYKIKRNFVKLVEQKRKSLYGS